MNPYRSLYRNPYRSLSRSPLETLVEALSLLMRGGFVVSRSQLLCVTLLGGVGGGGEVGGWGGGLTCASVHNRYSGFRVSGLGV